MRGIGIRAPTRAAVASRDSGALAELVHVDANREDQPAAILADGNALDASMFAAVYPMGAANERIRQSHAVDPARFYPLEGENRTLLIEMGTAMGHEGSDWQNPYAWAARGVLVYPNPASTGLSPAYGVNDSPDPASVALNVRATAGMLQTGGFGS